MFLRYRPGHLRDLPECRYRLRDQFAYDDHSLNALAALWRELLCQNSASTTVIEDLDRPAGQRIVWYCICVFIRDAFALHLRTEAEPIVGLELLRQWNQGPCPALNYEQIRQANSDGGVTILTVNSGTSREIMGDESQLPRIVQKVGDYMSWSIGSYRLKELLIELYTEFEHRWAVGYGLHLRNEYPTLSAERARTWLANGHRPCLYSTTRPEAKLLVGHPIVELFDYDTPRFFFSRLEQELLHIALSGDTDEEIADFLNVSPVTIKKRWLSIYERVGVVDAALLGYDTEEGKRGREKKRRLLQYLQHHMSEIRPIIRPK